MKNAVRVLAKILSELQGDEYIGSVIGGIVFRSCGEGPLGMTILRKTAGFCKVSCRGCISENYYEMEVTILLKGRRQPEKETGALAVANDTGIKNEKDFGTSLNKDSVMSFSDDEVHEFVSDVGDTNYIHQGPNPIVPGMEILEFLYRNNPSEKINLRFRYPVRAGEKIFFNNEKTSAYAGGREIFTVSYGG